MLHPVRIFRSDKMKKFSYIPCFAGLIICLVMLFVCTSDSVLTVHDDILTYMQVREGHLWQTALDDAKHGRICHIPLSFLLFIPYLPDNALFVRICSAAAIAFDTAGLFSLIKKNTDKGSAYLSCILFTAFAFISNQHNMFVAYIIGHQIPIGLILFSLSTFTDHFRNNKKSSLVISAVLLFLACMLYEASAAYIILFLFISMYKNEGNVFKNFTKIISDLSFHVVFIAVFTGIYLLWRKFYPSDYSGAKLWFGNIPMSLLAMFKYSFGMTPGLPLGAIIIKKYITFKEFKENADLFLLVTPLISALSFHAIFPKLKKPKNPFLLIIFCFTGMIIPNILISFTEKYTQWAGQNSYSYVTSFYSYFMMIPLFLVILKLIFPEKPKKPALLTLSSIVFLISLAAGINNEAWNIYFGNNLKRYEAFRSAVSSEEFSQLAPGTTVYIPDYTGIHNDMDLTREFAQLYSSADITFTTDPNSIAPSTPYVTFVYNSETASISIK